MKTIFAFICGAALSFALLPPAKYFISKEQISDGKTFVLKARHIIAVILCGGLGICIIRLTYSGIPQMILYGALLLVLLLVSCVDAACRTIPEICNIILLLLGAASMFLPHEPPLFEKLIGVVIISLPLLAVSLATGGFGGGDIKLLAACGLILGAKNIVLAFLIAVVAAALFGLASVVIFRRGGLKTKIAFAPFISIGVMTSALFGDKIIRLYLSLF